MEVFSKNTLLAMIIGSVLVSASSLPSLRRRLSLFDGIHNKDILAGKKISALTKKSLKCSFFASLSKVRIFCNFIGFFFIFQVDMDLLE